MFARHSFLAFALSTICITASAQALTADQVLKRMEAAYKTFTIYEDEGVVTQQFAGTSQEKKFKTRYNRDKGYRFEFTAHHPFPPLKFISSEMAIYPEEGTYRYSTKWFLMPQEIKSINNMASAVATITGTSSGSANLLASLLEPEAMKGWTSVLQRMKNPTRLADEKINGITCFVIAAKQPSDDSDLKVWIGQEDFVVRRITGSILGAPDEQTRTLIRFAK
jgi:outer membrane lipoprotein-sorting protein